MFLPQSCLAGQRGVSPFACREELGLVPTLPVTLGAAFLRFLTLLLLSSVVKMKLVPFRFVAELLSFTCNMAIRREPRSQSFV